MTVIRISNTTPNTKNTVTHDDGTSFPLEVSYDGWQIYADNADEVLGLLIDGYTDQRDDQSRLSLRVRLATDAQTTIQRLLNAGELFDNCTEKETKILLHDPYIPPAVERWQCAIPLVLIASFYHPLGDLPQPRTAAPGQVWWLDPSTAQSLLETLHGVRWLDLKIAAPRNQAARNAAYPDPPTDNPTEYRWRVPL